MKKIIITIILFISCLTIVKATGIDKINLKWTDSTDGLVEISKINNNYYVFTYEEIVRYQASTKKEVERYNIGYRSYNYYIEDNKIILIAYGENDEVNCIILDMNFKEIKRTSFNLYNTLYHKHVNGKYIFIGYTVTNTNDQQTVTLTRLEYDENLNIISKKEHPVRGSLLYLGHKNDDLYFCVNGGSDYCYKYSDNAFSDITYDEVPRDIVDDNLNHYIIAKNEENSALYDHNVTREAYNRILEMFPKQHEYTNVHLIIKKDGNNYAVLYYESIGGFSQTDIALIYKKTILYLDSNFNEKWRIEYPEEETNYHGDELRYIGATIAAKDGKILVAINTIDKQIVKIFDANKKEIIDISSSIINNSKYTPIYYDFTDTGLFAIYQNNGVALASGSSHNPIDNLNPTFLTGQPNTQASITNLGVTAPTIAYYFDVYYNIFTKIEGKGKVTVNRASAEASDKVEFIIEPEEGYVLGMVKVTDANGNVIYFTDYTFTMPSADVTIEVTFVKKEELNPNTKDIAITTLVIFFILSTGLMIYNKKRLKETE